MRGSPRTRVSIAIGVLTSVMIVASCQTPQTRSGLHACIEKADWPNYGRVVLEKWIVFVPNVLDQPTRYPFLADRIDYLEATCVSMNAALGVENDGAN